MNCKTENINQSSTNKMDKKNFSTFKYVYCENTSMFTNLLYFLSIQYASSVTSRLCVTASPGVPL